METPHGPRGSRDCKPLDEICPGLCPRRIDERARLASLLYCLPYDKRKNARRVYSLPYVYATVCIKRLCNMSARTPIKSYLVRGIRLQLC